MNEPKPYEARQLALTAETKISPARAPGVWKWYLAYCGTMTLLYLSVTVFGVALMAFPTRLADDEMEAIQNSIFGGFLLLIGGLFLLLYAIAPLLPKTNAAWVYGLLTISLGLSSLCTWPFCVALLWFWVKPETRAFFHTT